MGKVCKMVSLDTSTTATGVALFESALLSDYKEIVTPDGVKKEDALNFMSIKILNYLEEIRPDIVVIEMTVVPTNAGTQRTLSELVGVVRAYCILNNAEFVRLRPTEWRKLVKDEDEIIPSGRENKKKWSKEKVRKKYNIDVSDNVSDAILIGEARINQFKI